MKEKVKDDSKLFATKWIKCYWKINNQSLFSNSILLFFFFQKWNIISFLNEVTQRVLITITLFNSRIAQWISWSGMESKDWAMS